MATFGTPFDFYSYNFSAAMDLEEGMPVAIKRINQINNDLVARRTLRELRLLRHFQGHPNVL